jgi:hypothetical protein
MLLTYFRGLAVESVILAPGHYEALSVKYSKKVFLKIQKIQEKLYIYRK